MALRAKKPEEIKKRLKLMLYGSAGVGKTMAAIQMPKPYIIDTEKGTEQSKYVKLINASGGSVFQTTSAAELILELKALMTEKHDFRTVVIDPITNIEDNVVQSASVKYAADSKEGGDMRVWRERDTVMRRIVGLLLQLDMNVVMVMHGKIVYGENFAKLGTSYEGWKKWLYLFDLSIEISKTGTGDKAKRIAKVIKTRMDEFPDGDEFEWSYAELSKRVGKAEMEKVSVPVVLATSEQIANLRSLLETVKLPEGTEDKWLSKAGVDSFEDMKSEDVEKCIKFIQGRLTSGKKGE